MPFADESMKLVFAQVRNIGKQGVRVIVQSPAGHDPAHVGPDAAVAGRMRVAFDVSILVMDAMRRYPEKRSAFQCQSGADGEEIFHPLRRLVTAVREQPVISHADTKASGNPPQYNSDRQRFPGEHEERNDCSNVECAHEKSCHPADWLAKSSVVFKAHGY